MKQFLRYILTLVVVLLTTTNAWAECTIFSDGGEYEVMKYKFPAYQGIEKAFTISNPQPSGILTFTYWAQTAAIGGVDVTATYSDGTNEKILSSSTGSNPSYNFNGKIVTKLTFKGTSGTLKKTISNVKLTRHTSISASPATLPFPLTAVGTTSNPQTVTITYSNIGNNYNITSTNTNDFSISPLPFTYDKCGGEMQFAITFHPQGTTGGARSGSFTIAGDGNGKSNNNTSVTINVSGTAKGFPEFTWKGNTQYYVDESLDLSNLWTTTSNETTPKYSIKRFTSTDTFGSADPHFTDGTNTKILLSKEGELVLQMHQDASTTYSPLTKEVTIKIVKHTTNFELNFANEYFVDDEINKSTFFTNATNSEVAIQISDKTADNRALFTYNGSVLKANGDQLQADSETTTITVSQPETYKWTGKTLTKDVTVKKYDSQFSFTNEGANYVCKIDDIISESDFYSLATDHEIPATINVEILETANEDHPEVLIFNEENRQWEAKSAGKAKVTISQPENRKWTAYTGTRIVEIQKHTPIFTWNDPVYFNQTISDYFTTNNNPNDSEYATDIVISQESTDPDVAIIYFNQEDETDKHTLDLTTYYKETTPASSTTVTVSQAENWYWYAKEDTHTITPQNRNNQVEFTLTQENYIRDFQVEYVDPAANNKTPMGPDWQDGGIYFGGEGALDRNEGWNWNEKYYIIQFTGIPDSIYFDASRSGAATGTIKLSVSEGKTPDNLTEVWSNSNNSENNKIIRKLNPDSRYLKFSYTGNLWGLFKNITVTELNQFEAVPDRLDFGQQYVDEPSIPKTFDFKYANAGYKVQLQSNDSHFTVEPTYIDTIGGEKYGTIKDIKVTYHPTEEHNTANTDAKIYILDEAGHKDSVILTASAIKSTPTLSWTPAWSATEPIVLLDQTVTNAATSSNGYAVKYRSNDESIIQIINDGTAFIGKGTGRVEITAYQEPDRVYNAAETSKTFIVTDKIAQYIVWDDNLTNLRIGDAPITLNAQVWVMTDAASNTWEYSPTQTAELRYSSPNNAVVSIENNILTINGVGELLIEATIPADETYEYAHAQIPVRVRDNSTTCSDEDLIIPVKKDGTILSLEGKLEYDPYLATSEHIVEIDRTAGIPGELIFGYYGREAWWTLSGRIRVYESSDNGSTWQQVLSDADAVKPKAQELQYSPHIPLSTTATHIKFQRFESTNLGYHIIQYITVLPAKYIQAEDVDWGNIYVGNTPDTTITFNYSSVRSDMLLSTSHANLSVTPTTIRKDCGDWGTESLTITLNANTSIVGEFHEQVFIHDQVGNISETIHVYANIVKNSPTITWTPTDTIRSSAEWETKKTAIASSGDQVLYEITAGNQPNEYAYLNNDGKMILLRGGQITARAYTPATTTSNEMSVFHDFIIVVDPLFEDFANDNNWLNDNNWNIGRTPWATDSATIKANKHVQLTTEVSIDGVQFEAGSSIHITSTGGLSVGAQGIQGAASDGSSIIIDNLKTGAGFLRISPAYQGTMPRTTVNYQTRSTLDKGANKDATWQYIGAPGANCQFTIDGITWLYQWSEPQNWINKTGTLTLEPFAGYAITQYGKPTYALSAEAITSDQTITLTKTESGMNGNNLFANSYMAPIDAKNFTPEDFSDYNTGGEDIVKTFYIFNSGSWNDWNKYDTEQSKGFNGNDTPGQYCAIPALSSKYLNNAYDITTIPPMQGVYVIANTNGAQIYLNYDKHVWNAGTNPNVSTDMHEPMRSPQRMQAQEQMQQDSFRRIRLQLNSANSGADRLYVIQTDETTPLYDNGYDAPNQTVDGLTNIYTTESFGKMEVSCSNHIDSMYIGFQAGSDTQYTLSFSSLIGDMLYLQDLEQDTIVAMQQDMPYTFSATPLTINDHRFRLLLYPEDYSDAPNTPTDTDPADNIRVWLNNNVLHIIGAPANSTLHIYNISGAHIFTQIISDTPYTYNLSHLSASVYLLRINNYTYKVITK